MAQLQCRLLILSVASASILEDDPRWKREWGQAQQSQDNVDPDLVPLPHSPHATDLLSQRLYWVDSKLHQLSSVDFSGLSRKVLISSQEVLSHPFGVAVFEVSLAGSMTLCGSTERMIP